MAARILNRRWSREVDRRAIGEYGMSGLVLMENAGRGVADTLCSLGAHGPIVICCGKGNNAGDGFVIARHLDLRGIPVRVLLWAPREELAGDAAVNFEILAHSDVPVTLFAAAFDHRRLDEELRGANWIVDALLGTGARGEPRAPLDAVIEQMNASGVPILAVDLPSGLDCDSGVASRHTIRAHDTCTFVCAKPGLVAEDASAYVGNLHVLDIGTPSKLVDDIVLEARQTGDQADVAE